MTLFLMLVGPEHVLGSCKNIRRIGLGTITAPLKCDFPLTEAYRAQCCTRIHLHLYKRKLVKICPLLRSLLGGNAFNTVIPIEHILSSNCCTPNL